MPKETTKNYFDIYNYLIYLVQLSMSLCYIDNSLKLSTGFFVKIFKNGKYFYYLITNEHIINNELIKQKKTIKVYYGLGNKMKEKCLNPDERYFKDFRDINIDATIIEILPEDNIEIEYFLSPNIDNNLYEILNIIKLQIPLEEIFSISRENLIEINENQFIYVTISKDISTGCSMLIEDQITVVDNQQGNDNNTKDLCKTIRPTYRFNKNLNKYELIYNSKIYHIEDIYHSNGKLHKKYAIIIHKNTFISDEENQIINFMDEDQFKYDSIYEQQNELNEIHIKEIKLNNNDGYYIGHHKNGVEHGKGTIYKMNGSIMYQGDFVEGKREGYGIFYGQEYYYIGQWNNDLAWGHGILYTYNGNIIYDGDFIGDKIEGFGKYIYLNGFYYIGQFKNGKKNGKGTLYYENGNILYDGDFINDEFEGYGKLMYEDGKYYVGQFKQGLRNGKGIEYKKNGNIIYIGEYKDGALDGFGKAIIEEGIYYIGQFKNNTANGKGKIINEDGKIMIEIDFINGIYVEYVKWKSTNGNYIVGQFRYKDKHKYGKGTIYYGNGDIYEGELFDNELEGKGKFISKEGYYYEGQLKKGLKHGKGKVIDIEGNIYEGEFIDNFFDGHGKYTDKFGHYYIGYFKKGLKCGQGIEYNKNGKIKYEGDFIDDLYDGFGKKYYFDDKIYYEGHFKKGLKHGKGKVIIFEEIFYEGEFVNNLFEGKGKLILGNGDYYIGEFRKGFRRGKGVVYDKNGNFKYEGNFFDYF